jgi:hypothetical protein
MQNQCQVPTSSAFNAAIFADIFEACEEMEDEQSGTPPRTSLEKLRCVRELKIKI